MSDPSPPGAEEGSQRPSPPVVEEGAQRPSAPGVEEGAQRPSRNQGISGWWFILAGVLMIIGGVTFWPFAVADDSRSSSRLLFILLVGGLGILVAGIWLAIKGDRVDPHERVRYPHAPWNRHRTDPRLSRRPDDRSPRASDDSPGPNSG
jgi:hypothetical protein